MSGFKTIIINIAYILVGSLWPKHKFLVILNEKWRSVILDLPVMVYTGINSEWDKHRLEITEVIYSNNILSSYILKKWNCCVIYDGIYWSTTIIRVRVMVLNSTFNNISVILAEESGVPKENHRPAKSHWQTWLHNVLSSITMRPS